MLLYGPVRVFFPPICLMATQVWAGVMKRVGSEKRKGVRGTVVSGEIQTHDTGNHGRQTARF